MLNRVSVFMLFILYTAILGSEKEIANSQRPVTFTIANDYFFALSVPNVEESAKWYADNLGFEIKKEADLGDIVKIRILKRSGLTLELTQHRDAASLSEYASQVKKRFLVHGVFKIGFYVEDLKKMHAQLKANGVSFYGEVISEPELGHKFFIFMDNSNNRIQVFQRL